MTLVSILHYYEPEWETMVEIDASDGVVVGVLSQRNPETLLQHPITFFSKTMMPVELNYSILNKEMLVVVQSLEEWHAYLKGLQSDKPFLLYLDHCSLECFITTKKLLACQARQTEFLSQFYFKLTYCTRKSNERANALSYKAEDVQD